MHSMSVVILIERETNPDMVAEVIEVEITIVTDILLKESVILISLTFTISNLIFSVNYLNSKTDNPF